jgi:hypothetical protein
MVRKKPRNAESAERAGECIEFSHRTRLTVEEEGVSATFQNPRKKELRKIKYDKCYFTVREGGRADYIVGFDRDVDVIVELKGSFLNLLDARVQVTDTLERWRNNSDRYQKIVCMIVLGHTIPRVRSSNEAIALDFLRKHKTLLWIKENGEKHSFTELAGRS